MRWIGMKVIVSGGRYFSEVSLLWLTLDAIHSDRSISVLIEGASDDVTGPYVGADYWGRQWALSRYVAPVSVHADWKKFGRVAGPMRNAQMSKHDPELVIAFPGGKGTDDMVRKAKSANINPCIPFAYVEESGYSPPTLSRWEQSCCATGGVYTSRPFLKPSNGFLVIGGNQ